MKKHHTNIDYYMGEKGIKSTAELARMIGWSKDRLSYRFRGNITMDTLERLSVVFEVPVRDLIRSDYIVKH